MVKDGNQYRITIPVISEERGDVKRLNDILAPVFAKTNALQVNNNDRYGHMVYS